MLKTLLVLGALASVAQADTRVYDVRATAVVDGSEAFYPSCGAARRMLKDKHVLRITDAGVVTINGIRWTSESEEPDLLLSFHSHRGQKTYLLMDLYVNQRGLSGRYILTGVIPDEDDPRKQYVCIDAVYIDGIVR